MKFDSSETEKVLDHKPILLFPNPQQISLSIRASALVFEDPESQRLLSLIERVAPQQCHGIHQGGNRDREGTGRTAYPFIEPAPERSVRRHQLRGLF